MSIKIEKENVSEKKRQGSNPISNEYESNKKKLEIERERIIKESTEENFPGLKKD